MLLLSFFFSAAGGKRQAASGRRQQAAACAPLLDSVRGGARTKEKDHLRSYWDLLHHAVEIRFGVKVFVIAHVPAFEASDKHRPKNAVGAIDREHPPAGGQAVGVTNDIDRGEGRICARTTTAAAIMMIKRQKLGRGVARCSLTVGRRGDGEQPSQLFDTAKIRRLVFDGRRV